LPLYLEDISARNGGVWLTPAAWHALLAITREVAGQPVTPRIAWNQACRHLRPLLPPEHQDIFAASRRVNWGLLPAAYAQLLGRSNGEIFDLMSAATATEILYRHTTRPPREHDAPQPVEVFYFFQMCGHAKLPMNAASFGIEGGAAGLFRFCKYCWRMSIPGREICNDHASELVGTTTAVRGALQGEAKTPVSRRKQANRQRQRFDAEISRLMTAEVMEFHTSEFAADVLLPGVGRLEWLKRRRPKVAELLLGSEKDIQDDNMISLLLKLLHAPGLKRGAWEFAYRQVNSTIAQVPELIWPMLVRAEAWFCVRNEIRQKWGGARKNSGRPKRTTDLP
jgi:hypothetical protein